MDHPILKADHQPANRREAWIWLIEHAAWAPRVKVVGRARISIVRGQYACSLRYLATAWRWEEPKVRRFLAALRSDGMINALSDAHSTTITICNYDKYQSSELAPDAVTDAAIDAVTDAGPTRDRRTTDAKQKEVKEGKESKNGKSLDSKGPVSADPTPFTTRSDLFPGAEVVRLPPDQADAATEAWNAMAGACGLSKVRDLTKTRRTTLRARLRECSGLDGWAEVLRQVQATPFLLGNNDRGWKAEFDFVLQPKSFAKIREGAYANRGKPASSRDRFDGWHEILGTRRNDDADSSPIIDVQAEHVG
jgi:hypothetical protein